MKKILVFFVLFGILAAMGGCSATQAPAPTPEASAPTASTLPPQEQGVSVEESTSGGLKMTRAAQELGLTAENYPRIDGSTSTLGIVEGLWIALVEKDRTYYEAFYPREASKTVPSYHLLIDGEVDLIFVPYASEDVLQAAADAGVELEFYKVAAEALVFITPKENTAQNITREQVRSIYLDCGITNWEELDGPDRELVPICRNADSGSQSQMDNLILNNEEMHPDIQDNYVELTMEGMLEQVAFYHSGGFSGKPTESYAVGYTLYSYFYNMMDVAEAPYWLKLLDYEGVTPTTQTIMSGEYPLADGYYAVVRSDLPEDHPARAIISWLQSEDGFSVIENAGLMSLRDEE